MAPESVATTWYVIGSLTDSRSTECFNSDISSDVFRMLFCWNQSINHRLSNKVPNTVHISINSCHQSTLQVLHCIYSHGKLSFHQVVFFHESHSIRPTHEVKFFHMN